MNATLNPEIAETKSKFEPMENMERVDDGAFYVWKQRWGTWCSASCEGENLITALTREDVISGTRYYLWGRENNWANYESKTHEGTVGGKL